MTPQAEDPAPRTRVRIAPRAKAAVELLQPLYPFVDWLVIFSMVVLVVGTPLVFEFAARLGFMR